MVEVVRRLVLEQFGYIDVTLEIDLSLESDQIYEFAMKVERNLDAYKAAFWDLMKEKKQDRLERKAQKEKEAEKQKVENLKARIAELIEKEPDVVKAKLEEFNYMIDETTAATLILKDRDGPEEPKSASSGSQISPPTFPETLTFFKGKYGWSLYTDVALVPKIGDWIRSMPPHKHGRKNPELPKISNNGKALYVNDKEKAIIETEAQRQGSKTYDKED